MSDFVLMPSYLLPPPTYFRKIVGVEMVVINDEETYRKQSLRNHFEILTSQGRLMLTYPVKKPWRGIPMKDIQIDLEQKWIGNHWKSVRTAYGKSPFFEYYADFFEADLQNPGNDLIKLNNSLLKICLKILGIRTEIVMLSQIDPSKRTIDSMERQFSEMKEWDLHFSQEQDDMTYRQHFGNEFVQSLSIIDLLFNHGPEAGRYIH